MTVNYLEGALLIGIGCLVVVRTSTGDRFGKFVRKRSNVFLQVLATVLVAQIVGTVFFATTAQQPSLSEDSRKLVLESAKNLTFTAMLTILGLVILIVFLAVDSRRKVRAAKSLLIFRFNYALFAYLVVLVTFIVLAHLAMTLPTVVIGPLI